MIISENKKKDNAFYYEVCMLRILAGMGYLNDADLKGIVQIAAEDYGSSLVLDNALLCLNS